MLGEIGRRLRMLARRSRFDRELDDEMQVHRELRQESLREKGVPAEEAGNAARRRFGNTRRLREASANAWGWTWLEQLAQDVRFGARTLRRNPGFAVIAVATLALATGATTAIFSIVNGVLLQPLPFADPDRLVQVYGRNWSEDRGGTPDALTGPVGFAELDEFAKQSTSFVGFTGYSTGTRLLDGPAGPERLTAVEADPAFFSILGVDAIAGRTFRPDDPRDVGVISERLWRQRFDGDPSLPGRAVRLDGRSFTVIGVMPDRFQFPYSAGGGLPGAQPESRTDVWAPMEAVRASPSGPLRRGRVAVTARLKPGVTLNAALSELRVIAARIEEAHYRGTRVRVGVALAPLDEVVVGPVRRSLWILFAAVGLVLAAACANVANLLLARMAVRIREVVTRAALGAGRLRLVRQFLAESVLISLAGGLVGAFIARWGTQLLVSIGSAKIPRAHEVALDWRAFGFLLLACVVTAVLFGLAPALAAARVDVQAITHEAGGRASMGRKLGRLRDGLVAIEVALAFVLALGAALVVREVVRLQHVDTGMVTENVLTVHLTPRVPARDYYAIEERVARLPGVQAAGFTQLVPLQNWGWTADFSIRGRPVQGRPIAGLLFVTPGYFRVLGIPILRGRAFTEGDSADAPRVILVNDALARRYLPGEDPVGRDLDRGTIVGVVGNVRQVGLDRPAEPEIYYSAAQNMAMTSGLGMSLVVRATGPETPVDLIRSAVRDVNPNIAIFNVKRMEQVLADSLWELNLYRWLIGLFAALALLLAAIGLYGVISYNVTSRTREFAVRLALGSDPGGLARLVVGRAVLLTSVGLAGGILAALLVTPVVRSLPIGAGSGPGAYAVISVVLVAIALLASVVPAVRVARVNPATALRHE
jgi:predicted permease